MMVRAQKSEILPYIIKLVDIDVIDVEREGGAYPLAGVLATGADVGNARLEYRAAKAERVFAAWARVFLRVLATAS